MSKEQKLAFIKALKYEGLKVVRKDGKIVVYRNGDLACMVEAKVNGSIELTSCNAGAALVKACLDEALA